MTHIIKLLLRLATSRVPAIVVPILLVLSAILHLLLLARIATSRLRITVVRVPTHWVCTFIMRLAVVLMLWLMMLLVVVRRHLWRSSLLLSTSSAWLEFDEHPAFVVFGVVLKAEFLTYRFDFWLDLLDVTGAVIAFADNYVQVILACALRVAYSLLQDFLCLLNVLAVQVYRVAGYFAYCIVFPEDELRSLFVVAIGCSCVLF